MNDRESNYSQPKLELFGLFRALRHYRLYLIGVKNLYVEVDAKYIKGMLNEPDLQPNATMNRWIQGILLFDFQLVHVPATRHHGPDALSRREPTAEDLDEGVESDGWLDDVALIATTPSSLPINPPHHLPYSSTLLPSLISTESTKDQTLRDIRHFLQTLETPEFPSIQARKRFIKRTLQFFLRADQMFKRRGSRPPAKVIFDADRRLEILTQAHENLGHRGVHGVFQTIQERFYWPYLHQDVVHHVRSCHECQIRSTKKIEIPLTISSPPTIFTKLYVDIMHMPKAQNRRYLVAARDDLSGAAEGRALEKASARSLSRFFWEEIICRYGAIGEVVTDNGPEVKGAFSELVRRYGIPQIRISPYNSKANGVVERGHFTIREGLVKACEGRINLWPSKVHHAFFADKVTTRRATGSSPFFLLHGVHPVLPFDLSEATFMVDGFHSGMSSSDLLALRIRQLEKRPEDLARAAAIIKASRLRSKEQFEKHFERRLMKRAYKPGELVLVRNTAIEKELDRKTKPRYLGPYQVVRQTKGGSYVLQELDGTINRHGWAAFRLLPYFPRSENIPQVHFEEAQSSDESSSDSSNSDSDSD